MRNAYLEKQRIAKQTVFDIGQESGFQRCIDYMQAVLHDKKVMGNRVLGAETIKKIAFAVMDRDAYYAKAYSLDKEADYYQDKLDDELREIWGDQFQPFKERQPYIKQTGYHKAMKGWV